jgi:hypothetical protein
VPPQCQIGLQARLQGGEPLLLQPRNLRLRERLIGELGQRLPAPEVQRLPQRARGPVRRRAQRPGAFTGQPLEAVQVELLGVELEHIAGSAPL